MTAFDPNAGAFISPMFFDKVTITQVGGNGASTRCMTGNAVGGFYPDGSAYQTSVPQLIATAYLKGIALNPQPAFQWESSNPCVCAVDQNGNVTRVTSNQNLTFNSDGAANLTVSANSSNLGGLAQISATAKRADGSVTGIRGVVNIAVQDAASRQWGGNLAFTPYNTQPSNAQPTYNGTATPNYFNLVGDRQPPSDNS
jgi:hypothetical protein